MPGAGNGLLPPLVTFRQHLPRADCLGSSSRCYAVALRYEGLDLLRREVEA